MENKQVKYVGKIEELPTIDIEDFIKGGTKRIVFGPDRFWDEFVMRSFILEPGAIAPINQHPWMHWALCIGGEGTFTIGETEYTISSSCWMHVPGDIPHGFKNTSDTEPLSIICIVPKEGDVNPLFKGC
ncbi:MAG: cupin domain-containing protein [Tepidanaerobacteraceae bacterium]|nr:cupin domain-containing protein [Tepidanaerobacteraceae bacterium]